MNKTIRITALFCALSTCAAMADVLTLGSSKSDDLRADKLTKAPTMPLANSSKEAVSFSWALPIDSSLAATPWFKAQSTEYRKVVSNDQLRTGVTVHTTSAGAVVTLSPSAAHKGAGLNALDLVINTPDGRVMRGSQGMDQFVDQRAIQATGIPFSNGMVGFRLRESLGSGKFVLNTAGKAPAAEYVLHVLDRNSQAVLELEAPPQVFVGNTLTATGRFVGDALVQATAYLVSPEGERSSADVQLTGNSYRIHGEANRGSSLNNGLWELHATTIDRMGLQRDVKTAFAAVYATARFDGGVEVKADQHFNFGVEAVSSGRYEASAILYGTYVNGLQPVAMAATATWLEAGSNQLSLQFDPQVVTASGASAPFEVRHLALKDQSRLAVLQTLDTAIRIEQ